MSAVTTSIRRTRKNRSRFAAGALTFAVAAGVSGGAVSASSPSHVEPAKLDGHELNLAAAPGPTKAPAATTARHAAPRTAVPVRDTQAPTSVGIHLASNVQRFSKYPNNLDGWIRESLDILRKNNIPASYDGIMRNVMRESTGNPRAINLYDSNAAAGTPSKGLLQVIDPTFAAYHIKGTAFDIWNPVSNIVAACNYAAHNYGSMDNVNSAY